MPKKTYILKQMNIHLSSLLALVCILFSAHAEAQSRHKLMIFGGSDHKTYLGCLNCDQIARDSIYNRSGAFGACGGVLRDNLYCRSILSDFGSHSITSSLSACSTGVDVIDLNAHDYRRR